MRNNAAIRLKDAIIEVRLEWLDFDGDDCFNEFHITLTTETGSRRFDFGGCVVSGLKRVAKFFRDDSQASSRHGFRHPDIRYFDLYRTGDGFRFEIRFDGSGLCKQFQLQKPSVEIDDEFLREY